VVRPSPSGSEPVAPADTGPRLTADRLNDSARVAAMNQRRRVAIVLVSCPCEVPGTADASVGGTVWRASSEIARRVIGRYQRAPTSSAANASRSVSTAAASPSGNLIWLSSVTRFADAGLPNATRTSGNTARSAPATRPAPAASVAAVTPMTAATAWVAVRRSSSPVPAGPRRDTGWAAPTDVRRC